MTEEEQKTEVSAPPGMKPKDMLGDLMSAAWNCVDFPEERASQPGELIMHSPVELATGGGVSLPEVPASLDGDALSIIGNELEKLTRPGGRDEIEADTVLGTELESGSRPAVCRESVPQATPEEPAVMPAWEPAVMPARKNGGRADILHDKNRRAEPRQDPVPGKTPQLSGRLVSRTTMIPPRKLPFSMLALEVAAGILIGLIALMIIIRFL